MTGKRNIKKWWLFIKVRFSNIGEQGWRSGVPGSIPGPGVTCGMSLLLVLALALRGFSPGTPVFPLRKNRHFQIPIRSWNARTFLNEFLWTPWFSVGKQITLLLLLTFGGNFSWYAPVPNLCLSQIVYASQQFAECEANVRIIHNRESWSHRHLKENFIPSLSGDLKFPMVTAYPIKVIIISRIFSHFEWFFLKIYWRTEV